eukprot:TRINITY_DN1741_c0_g1_i1.p1 TRINITY_DN1741_c0_g1~~TRINITY_DN1741_c0_g1_i1.p1  ORF type:complete len:842 (+),score=175.96 TRINITY_DN1741_c0_g1_i1:149-2527(+)
MTESNHSVWSGFYKKTIKTRQDTLKLMYPRLDEPVPLPMSVADNMIENCIGTTSLPLGLGLNFRLNDRDYAVPMSVEEPSVVAAVSGAAKLIRDCGGFQTSYSGNIMVSQIQLLDVIDAEAVSELVRSHKVDIITQGNMYCRTMVKRGGGLRDVVVRILPYDRDSFFAVRGSGSRKVIPTTNEFTPTHMVIIHLHIDVAQSMGANTVNTVAEGVAPFIQELVGKRARVGLKIVTNFCTERRAVATFRIPISRLGYKKMKGFDLACAMLEGYAFAAVDPYRAVTHNKGVMNGVDAVALAMGQDTRAIEAGAHAWASRSGSYQPLTHYHLEEEGEGEMFFCGRIELPVPVGTKGGAIQSNPSMKFSHGILDFPTTAELGEIIAAVGLAQNFAALRALSSEGIQRGHMSLHSRNIAIQAGAPVLLVPEVSAYMVARGKINIESAKDYLSAHAILSEGTQSKFKRRQVPPSSFMVELTLEDGIAVSINIIFESLGKEERHILIQEGKTLHPLQDQLLGVGKDYRWFRQIFFLLETLQAHKSAQRSTRELQNGLKLLSIVMNRLIYTLVDRYPEETRRFLNGMLTAVLNPLSWLRKRDEEVLLVAFPLLDALWNVFKNQVDQSVNILTLANAIKEEQLRTFAACANSVDLHTSDADFEEYMQVHSRTWQVTLFLLLDLQSINPNLISANTLHFFFDLGHYLECEGMIGIDFSNWELCQTTGKNNSYLYWLQLQQKKHTEQTIQTFLETMAERNQKMREKLLSDKDVAAFFDVSLFLDNLPVVQRYYAIAEMLKSAKL